MTVTQIPPEIASSNEGYALPEKFPYEVETFHQSWWRFLASRFDIPVKNRELLVLRKRMLKGLLTLRELRISGWNSAWSQDLSLARLAELEEMRHTARWDYFRYSWNESRESCQALDALKESGLPYWQIPGKMEHLIDLGKGFEGYLMSLSANGRKGLKKKVRLAEPLNPQRVVLTEESDIDAFYEEFIPIHQAYWDEKAGESYLNIREERDFIIGWSKALFKSGQLVLDKITLNGETVNLGMGIKTGTSFYWLFTINTGLYADNAPGMVGLYLRVKEVAEEGILQFKMGAGDYFYKVQSANAHEQDYDVIIVNPSSIKGRLYLKWMKRQHAKGQARLAQEAAEAKTSRPD